MEDVKKSFCVVLLLLMLTRACECLPVETGDKVEVVAFKNEASDTSYHF